MTFTRNEDGSISLRVIKAELRYLSSAVRVASGEWGQDATDKEVAGILSRATNEALQ